MFKSKRTKKIVRVPQKKKKTKFQHLPPSRETGTTDESLKIDRTQRNEFLWTRSFQALVYIYPVASVGLVVLPTTGR